MQQMPIARLSTGLVVANFSSPHKFNFDDGTVLGACSPERAKLSMLESVEVVVGGDDLHDMINLELIMSDDVRAAIDAARTQRDEDGVDVIIVPFPVLNAMADCGLDATGFATIRIVDRVAKVASSRRFCAAKAPQQL